MHERIYTIFLYEIIKKQQQTWFYIETWGFVNEQMEPLPAKMVQYIGPWGSVTDQIEPFPANMVLYRTLDFCT